MTTKTVEKKTLPVSSMGNERTLTIIRYGSGSAGKKAYVQAGLHADEAPGYLVMHHLIDLLDSADAAGTIEGEILLIPVANPIGAGQWRDEVLRGRFDYFDNTNFNRKHLDITEKVAENIQDTLTDSPDQNKALVRQAMADVLHGLSPGDESARLKHLLLSLSFDADIVLDLHCDYQAVTHVYMGGPLWPEASDLSAQIGSAATLLAKVSGDNPYDEACSRIWWELAEKFPAYPIPFACLAATIELRGISDVSHELASRDAENIFLFLQRRGLISGKVAELPPLINDATPLRGVAHIKASAPGVVVYFKTPGNAVHKGDLIAEIVNPLESDQNSRVSRAKSTIDGILISVNVDRFARPGRMLAKVAGKEPLTGKGENLLTL
ncbi:MAG: succinylglutamate desuccinylase [Deltaproteobacteria bacterium]|nr:MAG: succinylglutamate desuccinylase [Deltaproteobacteria bacterium]